MKQRRLAVTRILFFLFGVLSFYSVSAAPQGYASLDGGTSGGAGGEIVYVNNGWELVQALRDKQSNEAPLTIIVNGRITRQSAQQDNIDIKQTRNLSLIGKAGGAEFDGIGIRVKDSRNIIIRNLIIHHVDVGAKDAIGLEGNTRHVWIDHNELYASLDVDKDYYDGLLDTKSGVEYVTISYNYLHDSWKASLHGASDSDTGDRKITFHHNRWENLNSRTPLFRFGEGHLFNNYYYNVHGSGINSRMNAKLRIENNHFERSNNPVVSFYSKSFGFWDLRNNMLDGVTWQQSSSGKIAGADMQSTTQLTLPYHYVMDDTHCVRSIVLATAGAGKGLKRSDGRCNVVDDDHSETPPGTEPPGTEPPGTEPPGTEPPPPSGQNLALLAAADGSSKARGSSYNNVRDGNADSFWQAQSQSNERVSLKRMAPFNTVVIRERNFATRAWRLVNDATGTVLASGSQLGLETVVSGFGTLDIDRLSLYIDQATKPVQISEFELYLVERPIVNSVPANAVRCAGEKQTCSFNGTGTVYYGARGQFTYRVLNHGTACTNEVFGDPIPGKRKACFVVPVN